MERNREHFPSWYFVLGWITRPCLCNLCQPHPAPYWSSRPLVETTGAILYPTTTSNKTNVDH